ncbi:MAG: chemotaxis protein CheX [Oleiphilaceae bacterium]|nr:chemotaxis protein CheX [Oleiphilaceae bacterium]
MTKETQIVSKVLVHECNDDALSVLKDVCTKHNLIGLKVCTGNNTIGLRDASNEISEVMASNVDLGAVFLSEAKDLNGVSGLELCTKIHRARPELPIFMRREHTDSMDDLPPSIQEALAGCYQVEEADKLNELVDNYICSMYYPAELASGVIDLSKEAFESIIPGVEVRNDLPYLVKDQIIYGELFSLIPLESDWCRGYMMLQTTENEVLDLIRSGASHIEKTQPDSRDSNGILNEATNLIWGSIRSRYFTNEVSSEGLRTQVPIMVNHQRKHISFGSTEPQLCFKFTLHDPQMRFPDITLYQRLIFNLSWSPEKFAESEKAVDEFVDNGELEFF